MNAQPSPEQALDQAIAHCGGVANLAALIGVSRQAIYKWSRVPADRVVAVERATQSKVTRYQLCPELYEDMPATRET